jgi:phage recombination protein Bet
MTTELKPMASAGLINVPSETIQVLKKTVCADHTDDQVKLFLMYCQSKGLDPFAREVFSIIRKGKQTFQTGIDGLRSMADETSEFDGCDLYWCAKDGKWMDAWLEDVPPYAAKAIVVKRGCSRPFVAVAKWSEYKPEEDWMWKKMPSNQLGKCAEALALRKAFPRKLGGLYASEEMAQADKSTATTASSYSTPKDLPTTVAMPQERKPEAVDAELVMQAGSIGALDKAITDQERAMLFKIAKTAWGSTYEENLRKYLKAKFNTEHTSKLSKVQFDACVDDLKEAAAATQANAAAS